MIGKPKLRGSHAPPSSSLATEIPSTPLECAEEGCSHASHADLARAPRRPVVRYARRGNYGLTSFWGGPLPRARLRRLVVNLRRNPRGVLLLAAGATIFAILLGVWIVIAVDSARPAKVQQTVATVMPTHQGLKVEHTKSTEHLSKVLQGKVQTDRQRKLVSQPHVPSENGRPVKLLIKSIRPAPDKFFFPSNLHFDKDSADYGELELDIFEEDGARRNIAVDFESYEKPVYRDPDAPFDDDGADSYYFDDDRLRGLTTAYDADRKEDPTKVCRKISDHELSFPNCNDFHQLDRLDPSTEFGYLNHGGYREVFSMVHHFSDQSDRFAIKDILYAENYDFKKYEFVRMDAIVAERLSFSPRTYDIYGFCGIGIMSEYFYHGDIEHDVTGGVGGDMKPEDLQDEADLKPQNNLTGIEKLVLSLEMAEAIAELHGYTNGLIVHDDIQLSQFLFNQNRTRLILNDFNRAEFPLFDEKANDYCRYKNGRGGGNWRSPEEYRDDPLLEEIDVWSMGNNIYVLLTGLNPFYNIETTKEIISLVLQQKKAYIDPRWMKRSPAEAKLAELIPKCFEYEPKNRISIFEVVDYLRHAVNELLDDGMTRESVLQGIKPK